MGSLMAMIVIIFIMVFATGTEMLEARYVLVGIPWGVFQTITTTYAAEVCPVVLRPYLTMYVNLCWVMGQLISSGVLRSYSTAATSDQWAWGIPYAIQWAFPIPILIAVLLAPESPWWLVRKGRLDQAENSLRRLTSLKEMETTNFDPTNAIAMMIHTNEMEQATVAGTSSLDCFRAPIYVVQRSHALSGPSRTCAAMLS